MFGLVDYSSSNEDDDLPSSPPPLNEKHSLKEISPPSSDLLQSDNHRQDLPNQQTVDRIKHYLQLKSQGFNLTDSIRSKKDFGNPYILQKVISYYHIEEMGSNYPITLWNPALYSTRQTTLDSSAESLDQPATTQPEPQTMTQSRKRENEAMDSTGLPTESINSKKPRKSRWDQQM